MIQREKWWLKRKMMIKERNDVLREKWWFKKKNDSLKRNLII